MNVRKAAATADSLLRCPKNLFGKKLLPHLQKEITLPTEVPFSSANNGNWQFVSPIYGRIEFPVKPTAEGAYLLNSQN